MEKNKQFLLPSLQKTPPLASQTSSKDNSNSCPLQALPINYHTNHPKKNFNINCISSSKNWQKKSTMTTKSEIASSQVNKSETPLTPAPNMQKKCLTRFEQNESLIGRAIMMLSKCLEKICQDSHNSTENIILVSQSLKILQTLHKNNELTFSFNQEQKRKAKSAFRVMGTPKKVLPNSKNVSQGTEGEKNIFSKRSEEYSFNLSATFTGSNVSYPEIHFCESEKGNLYNSLKPLKLLNTLKKNDDKTKQPTKFSEKNEGMLTEQEQKSSFQINERSERTEILQSKNKKPSLVLCPLQIDIWMKAHSSSPKNENSSILEYLKQRELENERVMYVQEKEITELRQKLMESSVQGKKRS